MTKAQPTIDRIEKRLHPRLERITKGLWLRITGVLIMLLGALLSLPVPFGNILPSIPIAILALGMIEFDGYFILTGLVLGATVTIGMSIFWSEVIYQLIQLIV